MKIAFIAAALALSTSAAFACGTQITDPFPCNMAPTRQEVMTGHYQPGHWHMDDYRRWNYQQQMEHYQRYKGLPGAIPPTTPPELAKPIPGWHPMYPTAQSPQQFPQPQQAQRPQQAQIPPGQSIDDASCGKYKAMCATYK